jgi:hypothetical protein
MSSQNSRFQCYQVNHNICSPHFQFYLKTWKFKSTYVIVNRRMICTFLYIYFFHCTKRHPHSLCPGVKEFSFWKSNHFLPPKIRVCSSLCMSWSSHAKIDRLVSHHQHFYIMIHIFQNSSRHK